MKLCNDRKVLNESGIWLSIVQRCSLTSDPSVKRARKKNKKNKKYSWEKRNVQTRSSSSAVDTVSSSAIQYMLRSSRGSHFQENMSRHGKWINSTNEIWLPAHTRLKIDFPPFLSIPFLISHRPLAVQKYPKQGKHEETTPMKPTYRHPLPLSPSSSAVCLEIYYRDCSSWGRWSEGQCALWVRLMMGTSPARWRSQDLLPGGVGEECTRY